MRNRYKKSAIYGFFKFNENNQKYECKQPRCNQELTSHAYTLRRHMQRKHPDIEVSEKISQKSTNKNKGNHTQTKRTQFLIQNCLSLNPYDGLMRSDLRCRLCLAETSETTSLLESREGLPISVIVMIVCPIKVEVSDELPNQICENCLEIVLSSYQLRYESLKSDRYLREKRNATIFEPSEDIQEESYISFHIKEEPKENPQQKLMFVEPFDEHQYKEEEANNDDVTTDRYSVDCGKFNKNGKHSATKKTIQTQNTQIYFCDLCSKTYNSKLRIVNHMKSVHILKKNFNNSSDHLATSCFWSDESFDTEKLLELEKHIKLQHDSAKPNEFVCHVCSKYFTEKHKLTRHLKIHAEKTFLCSHCPASFTYPDKLKLHEKVHDPKHHAKYQCEHCSKQYSYRQFLKIHIMEKHLNIPRDRKHCCTFCHMKFHNKYRLQRHLRKHTGEKPFSCQYCSSSYTQKEDLNKHLRRTHIGDALYDCTFDGCTESFRLKIELRDHYKVHYKNEKNNLV